MNICLIGSTGYWGRAAAGYSRWWTWTGSRVISKGFTDETMTGVLDACKQHRQTPKVFDDYREMLDSIKPALYALRAVDKWLEIKACQSELIAKSL